ncbi:MAG: flagellar motor protein [Deltaproteobacteria bacterium]|nr:flagellar motor protein [Deltaproteobacteria bacterium]
MDIATIAGIILALGAILGGQALEGGHIGSIMQPTAALIVLGGTVGALGVQFPGSVLKQTLSEIKQVFMPDKVDLDAVVKTVVSLANKVRRDGLVSVEKEVTAIEDPFFRKALELAVDGTDVKVLREALETEIGHHEEHLEGPAKVLEAAGGYLPTVGIIGAVLGLIHVMENLSEPEKLGGGIAVAFVATVYGVGAANLLALPMAGKLKARSRMHIVKMELAVEGVCAIAEGENPRLIERKLSAFVVEKGKEAEGQAAGAEARA